ncbi:EF-hand domain-containing protein [Desulfovibrio sp. OttesenSCG-928-M14]|nr:EF-hand domain-containing protein [Desulfovibrio sp. OttesenSCG-928-M14]
MLLFRFFLSAIFCLCALLLVPHEGLARPEMAAQHAQNRFTAMDANNDGQVNKEEFLKAQPEMKEAAFDAIDLDKDGAISAAEWENFVVGHGRQGEGGAIPGHNATERKAPALIMPPKSGD